MAQKESGIDVGRREALKTMSAVAAAIGAPALSGVAGATAMPADANQPGTSGGPYNILFILTDQERYFRPGELPKDYRLPGHERLIKKGIVFENHHINSCVCTPSRSVVYTGRHIHFDLAQDPLERTNLALERDKHRDLLEAMNAKLNALLGREVGERVGQMLPGGIDGGWVATGAVNDV